MSRPGTIRKETFLAAMKTARAREAKATLPRTMRRGGEGDPADKEPGESEEEDGQVDGRKASAARGGFGHGLARPGPLYNALKPY